MESNDKKYLHNQLYTYKHPAISTGINIVYKMLGIMMAGVTIYLLSAKISETSLNEVLKKDWWLILYLSLAPFFFFMKEIQEKRQTYLAINF